MTKGPRHLVGRHSESMEACVDRYVEFKTLSVVEDYVLVLCTHVSRSSCCFHVATLTPRPWHVSCPLSSRVTITKMGCFYKSAILRFFFSHFYSKYPQNFLPEFMEEGNGITEKCGIKVVFMYHF